MKGDFLKPLEQVSERRRSSRDLRIHFSTPIFSDDFSLLTLGLRYRAWIWQVLHIDTPYPWRYITKSVYNNLCVKKVQTRSWCITCIALNASKFCRKTVTFLRQNESAYIADKNGFYLLYLKWSAKITSYGMSFVWRYTNIHLYIIVKNLLYLCTKALVSNNHCVHIKNRHNFISRNSLQNCCLTILQITVNTKTKKLIKK